LNLRLGGPETFGRKEKSSVPAGIRNTDHSASSCTNYGITAVINDDDDDDDNNNNNNTKPETILNVS
jgi:hypothetical protein